MIHLMLLIWSLVPLLLQNLACTSEISWFSYCWSLAWRIWGIILLACEMNVIVWWFEHIFALCLFGIGMKTDLFQFCGCCCLFQIYWHIAYSTLTGSSVRIWNSSAGIPPPPLALFVVMLPKAHLISHCRMSSSRWVTTLSWLSGSLRPSFSFFFFFLLLFFFHLFLLAGG